MADRDWEKHDKKVLDTKHWFVYNVKQEDFGPISKRLAEFSTAIIRPQIWREFRPTKDQWEFTIYFRLGPSVDRSMKMRADLAIDVDEFIDMTEDRFFELCQIAILDVGLWAVERGDYWRAE